VRDWFLLGPLAVFMIRASTAGRRIGLTVNLRSDDKYSAGLVLKRARGIDRRVSLHGRAVFSLQRTNVLCVCVCVCTRLWPSHCVSTDQNHESHGEFFSRMLCYQTDWM